MSREAICLAAVERFKQILSDHGSDRPFVLGLGTGSTVAHFASLLKHGDILSSHQTIVIIPTSLQSVQLALQLNSASHRIILGSISQYSKIDCLVDGFDELDLTSGWMIKGGGGAHTMEMIVAMCSKHNIYIGSGDKVIRGDGFFKSVPVEVLPGASELLLRSLGAFHVAGKIRECAGGKMGPVITDNGNLIVDVDIKTISLKELPSLIVKISGIPGVIGHGLFMNLTDEVFTSDAQNVTLINRKYDRLTTDTQ